MSILCCDGTNLDISTHYDRILNREHCTLYPSYIRSTCVYLSVIHKFIPADNRGTVELL